MIQLLQPKRIIFGNGCASNLVTDLTDARLSRIFFITSPSVAGQTEPFAARLKSQGTLIHTFAEVNKEPTLELFEAARLAARSFNPDAIVGIGGGSVLDVAKLVAALHNSSRPVNDFFGINLLGPRQTYLACLPTTAGTGSEVSPNAILLDENERLKKGVISPHLVPDAAYVDPSLMVSMPPSVTARTGLDALSHCIEVYASRFAHPITDLYTLEGIRVISQYLPRAVVAGDDIEARANVALGSLYGGLGLAPVNTAAVHALAYPLGGEFHIAHGLSIAVLLPHVLEFNLPPCPERYARVALSLGAKPAGTSLETAQDGLMKLRELIATCGIEPRLSKLGIPEEAIPRMAQAAMTVTRLLKNNLRELTAADAEAIYRAAY